MCECVCVSADMNRLMSRLSKTVTSIDFHSRAVDVGNVNLIWFLHVTGVAWQKKSK